MDKEKTTELQESYLQLRGIQVPKTQEESSKLITHLENARICVKDETEYVKRLARIRSFQDIWLFRRVCFVNKNQHGQVIEVHYLTQSVTIRWTRSEKIETHPITMVRLKPLPTDTP